LSHRAFEPKNFYDLATHVKTQLFNIIPNELKQAADRTCISRIYYAVFLSFRDKILALPIRNAELKRLIERTNDAHAIIAETIRIIDVDIGDFIVNLRTLRNFADYETGIALSPDKVAYAFKIADEIFSKLDMIVSKIKEPDIVLAWNKMQRKRQKGRFYFGAT
jgi:uncharacterized protein (UPF0332 family)